MAIVAFAGLVVAVVAVAVWRSGAGVRNRDDARTPAFDSRNDPELPGGGIGGWGGVSF